MSGEKRKSKGLSCIVPRGFLKAYLLEIINDGPVHGYALMERIHKITGFWKPSPGTIYPLLNSLVREGYVEIIPSPSRRKEYRLTRKGKKISSEMRETKSLLNEKISDLLSKMSPATKKELRAYFKSMVGKHHRGPMIYPMHRMFSLILKLSRSPEKIIKASEIVEEANTKLAGLLEKGDSK